MSKEVAILVLTAVFTQMWLFVLGWPTGAMLSTISIVIGAIVMWAYVREHRRVNEVLTK